MHLFQIQSSQGRVVVIKILEEDDIVWTSSIVPSNALFRDYPITFQINGISVL
jgi:hypothetical protein